MDRETKLAVISGIWEGYMSYLPKGIPYIDTQDILEGIFLNASSAITDKNGEYCLHKETIKCGIHRQVLKLLDNTCCVCNLLNASEYHIHHVKKKIWPWGRALGFVVLCEECHKPIHSDNQPCSRKELKILCQQYTDPSSRMYLRPATNGNNSNILTRHNIDGALNYYSLNL